ncbi:protein-tyrosine-phosphatase [Wandonia haliotis]|uniref:Protein-tyrosine-phosphatase n=1 Tax=Wandonia haliotis TaxID=574963 RepID=A0ABP3Y1F7_9FLAO
MEILSKMLYTSLYHYCQELTSHFSEIPEERKQTLKHLASHITNKINQEQDIHLVYICTHNSRRSFFGQVWAAVAAEFYGLSSIKTYSAGTEATLINPTAITTLLNVGYSISGDFSGDNPVYKVKYTDDLSVTCFSKTINHEKNPKKGFIAIMTCSEANESCPVVPGADLRISTPYEDPKQFDKTPVEKDQYEITSRKIALEILFTLSLLNT